MKIQVKLLIFFLCLVAIPLLLTGLMTFTNVEMILKENLLEQKSTALEKEVSSLNEILSKYHNQVLLLRELPPVQGIIRAKENGGIDPVDESTLSQWRNRFEIIFSRMIEINPSIDQIRYIDETGQELVRVNNNAGNIQAVHVDSLQTKANRPYFKETMAIPKDGIYVSEIEYNEEQGVVELPHKPVIRFATPVFDSNGVQRGIVIINVLGDFLTEVSKKVSLGDRIVTDQDGSILVHPDSSKSFSLAGQHNYFEEQPELKINTQDLDAKIHHDVEEKEFRVWRKIFYNPFHEDRYWIEFAVIPESVLFEPIDRLKSIFFLVSLVVLILTGAISLVVSRSISTPVKKLTEVIDSISQGKLETKIPLELKGTNDEISKLSRAFDRTLVSLKLAILRVGLTKEQIGLGEALRAKKVAEKSAQQEQRRAEQLQYVLDQSSLAATTDVKGDITYSNQKFFDIAHYSWEELKGQNHRIVKSNFHSSSFYKKLWNTITKGKSWEGDIRNKAKDGSIYWVRSTISPLFDKNKKITGYAAVRTPITDLMKPVEDIYQKELKGAKLTKGEMEVVERVKSGMTDKYYWFKDGKPLRKTGKRKVALKKPTKSPTTKKKTKSTKLSKKFIDDAYLEKKEREIGEKWAAELNSKKVKKKPKRKKTSAKKKQSR